MRRDTTFLEAQKVIDMFPKLVILEQPYVNSLGIWISLAGASPHQFPISKSEQKLWEGLIKLIKDVKGD